MALAQVPLRAFLNETLIPYESDEVTRLIVDTHDLQAFAPIAHLTVGEFREWLLSDATDTAAVESVTFGLTPEMVAAVSKLMRNQDLILAARKRPSSRAFARPSACRGACRCVFSPITRPTIPRASPHPSSTVSCTAAATR